MFRDPVDQHDIGKHLAHLGPGETTPDLDGQRFPAEFVEQRRQAPNAPVMGRMMNDIIRTDVIAVARLDRIHEPSLRSDRLVGLCLAGTLSRSRRPTRATRSRPTSQP